MKIGMMADTYKPYVSGVTNYIDLNKRALEAAGHEVYVFTFGDLDYQDDELRVIRNPGVPLSDTGFYLSLRYKTRHFGDLLLVQAGVSGDQPMTVFSRDIAPGIA